MFAANGIGVLQFVKCAGDDFTCDPQGAREVLLGDLERPGAEMTLCGEEQPAKARKRLGAGKGSPCGTQALRLNTVPNSVLTQSL